MAKAVAAKAVAKAMAKAVAASGQVKVAEKGTTKTSMMDHGRTMTTHHTTMATVSLTLELKIFGIEEEKVNEKAKVSSTKAEVKTQVRFIEKEKVGTSKVKVKVSAKVISLILLTSPQPMIRRRSLIRRPLQLPLLRVVGGPGARWL